MKKALALSISTSWNCCLSPELSKFSCDVQAFSMYLEKIGYEIFVHDPYKLKKKSEKIKRPTIKTDELIYRINEFDLVFTRIFPFHIEAFSGVGSWGPPLCGEGVIKAIKKYNKKIYNVCVDYREKYRHPLNEDKCWKVRNCERCTWDLYNPLKEMFNTKIIPAVPSPSGIFPEEKVFKNFTDYVMYTHNIPKIYQYNKKEKEWDFIYGGVSKISCYRKERLKILTEGLSRATVGNNKIRGWDYISGRVWGEEYDNLMKQSRISLVVADVWHNFRTLRFFESFVRGGVLFVDEEYKSGCDFLREIGLDNRIVNNSNQIKSLINNSSYENLYQEQLRLTM